MAPGWRSALSNTRSTSSGPRPHRPARSAGRRSPLASSFPARGAARRPCPAPTTSATTSLRSSAAVRTPVRRSTPPVHRHEKRLRSTRSRWRAPLLLRRGSRPAPTRPSAAMPSSRAIAPTSADVLAEPEQVLHQDRMRRRRSRQPRHDACRQHGPAAQHLLHIVGQRRRALLQPDRAREARRSSRDRSRAGGWPRPTAGAGPAPDVRRRGRLRRWPAVRRRCPTGRSIPDARAARRGPEWSAGAVRRPPRWTPNRPARVTGRPRC